MDDNSNDSQRLISMLEPGQLWVATKPDMQAVQIFVQRMVLGRSTPGEDVGAYYVSFVQIIDRCGSLAKGTSADSIHPAHFCICSPASFMAWVEENKALPNPKHMPGTTVRHESYESWMKEFRERKQLGHELTRFGADPADGGVLFAGAVVGFEDKKDVTRHTISLGDVVQGLWESDAKLKEWRELSK